VLSEHSCNSPYIWNDDPRLEFYNVRKEEGTEDDTDYSRKYDEDLNTMLISVYHLLFVPHSPSLRIQTQN
jgi:hypothetical protein